MNDPEKLVREWFDEARRSGNERLPAERLLAERLGLSRAALRQGLAALDAEGLLLRQVGRGTFLSQGAIGAEESVRRDAWRDATDDASPRDMVTALLIIQPVLAKLAAREASARAVATLHAAEAELADAQDWQSFDRAEASFRRAIAVAASNPILLHVFDTIEAARKALDWGCLRERPPFDRESVRSIIARYTAVGDAIAKRDGDAAETALAHHLMVENATVMS